MNDDEMVRLIAEDCEKGMTALIRQYSGLVYTIVYSKIATVCVKEDAEECASDVFMEFYRNLKSYNPEKGSVKAFLSVIAKRLAIARYHALSKNKADVIGYDDALNPDAFFWAESDSADIGSVLLDAIESLGKPDSVIIMKKYYYGETAGQIAYDLSMKEATVHKRYERALKKLKKKLTEAGCNG